MMKPVKRGFALATLSLALISPNLEALAATSDPLPDAPEPTITTRDGGVHKETREVTWRSLPRDFAHDQKDIWFTFPGKLATGHHWIPVLGIAGGTAALIYADPHIARYFRNHEKNVDKVDDVFDPMITTAEVIALPAGLMTAGYIRHDPYQVNTALSSTLAYGDSAVVDLVTKAITRRQRPSDVEAAGTFTGTFFNAGKSPFKGSSFPSGHAAAAFSVATVVANRYGNHKWVPWTVYTMATLISLSRVTTNAHFSSDVFLGASYGYTISKFQVLRPRR
jgi:membrane-associated PAP2 superfamily phosphatase